MLFIAISLLSLSIHAKRDYNRFHYFAVQIEPNLVDSLDIGTIEGQIGELKDYFWVSVPVEAPVSSSILHKRLDSHPHVQWVERQLPVKRLFKRDKISDVRKKLDIKDPEFGNQWHIINTETAGYDLNCTGVWEQGITGTGVTVGFIDDGLDHENPDLKENFSLEGSYDFNFHKKLPTPSLWDDTHGTRCAGEVGAVKNDVCGVGIAYTSKVAGIRVLSGALTNADEAAAVNYAYNTTQIYSCSWGPSDNGRTMEAPPEIVTKAVENGIKNGRNGLGSLFVFAAGNGGRSGDNCNFDGYTNSIYTMTIAAMDHHEDHPQYSEECPAILMTMYSSRGGLQGIVTTDWKNGCTNQHGGTSAAAPLASGVMALVLSIRPDLNWRDAQRLSIENALVVNAKDADWKANGAKRPFNHKYGYGTYDTWKIIEAAKTFVSVNPQVSVSVPSGSIGLPIPQTDEGLINRIKIDQALIDGVGLKRLEHVSVTVNIEHQNRGDVAIYLKSPDQFVSRLIESRRLDDSTSGFPNWTMMSVAHWDETPVGEWEISIIDKVNPDKTGTFKDWTLTLWGESASSAPKESIPSSTLSTSTSTTTTVNKPTATTSVASSTIIVSSLPNGSSGSTTDHIASNTPVVLFTIMVFSMLIMIGVYIYRNGLVKKKDYEFEQLDDFDDNDFDVLALNDLESARNDVLFEVNDNQP